MIQHPTAKSKKDKLSSAEQDAERIRLTELLVRVGKQRDQQAFAELFEHYAPIIKSFYLYKSSGTDSEVEELVQEAMLKVWTRSPGFDPQKSSASTWVFTVARNSRIDMHRHKSRHNPKVEAQDLWDLDESNHVTPLNSLEEDRLVNKVQHGLTELPEEQVDVIKKIYLEGLSQSEAAKALGLPLGTVKSRVRLAYKKLKLKWQA